MSQQKIDALKKALEDLGISYDPDFGNTTDSYGIRGENYDLIFSIRIAADEKEIPEVLKPFCWSDYEVFRAISKNSTEKRTLSGARFEIALSEYSYRLLKDYPPANELTNSLDGINSIEELNTYQMRRQEIWDQMWAENTLLQQLQKDLDENYY